MKTTIYTTLALAAICMFMTAQGCNKGKEEHGHDHDHDHGAAKTAHDDDHGHRAAPAGGTAQSAEAAHAALHRPKYNEVLVEFPGHRYAMEIIDEKETTGLVTAFVTDAHFTPVTVDAQEVRLNFVIGGAPKAFTLTRAAQEAGKPATFTLTDMELATLICEGWQGDATASVEIGGTPFNAKLVKLSEHGHEGHTH